MKYLSNCHCGRVNLSLETPGLIDDYLPRQCDCEFCRKYDMYYLSAPGGILAVHSKHRLASLKHGSEQADFWQCSNCKSIVAVSSPFGENTKGAVNGNLFSKYMKLSCTKSVSPRLLSPSEKRKRWLALWMNVEFI